MLKLYLVMKMTIYENGKRIVSRAITFIDDNVLLMERHRLDNGVMLHYFTIPGGGVEENETFREAAIRETMEETCCEIEIVKDLEVEDFGSGICHWFYAKYISGTPTLGGEELERNNPNNHFKVVLIPVKDIDNINILGIGRRLIKECYNAYKD
jgi:ADP-ribose pyrophosphatase YjhB (NUDIX family)